PQPFSKILPANGITGLPKFTTLSWGQSQNATSYEYCADTVNNNICDTVWVNNGGGGSASPSTLESGTTYYWQIRARNNSGTTEADGGAWRTFSTIPTLNVAAA